jgi:alpha-L-rhamnosidase
MRRKGSARGRLAVTSTAVSPDRPARPQEEATVEGRRRARLWQGLRVTETTPSTASWITAPGQDPQHPLLRTTFTPRDHVTSARLLVTGLGAFHTHLNGARVSADELAPGQTHFGKTVLLNAYDVTALIEEGDNALSVEVGRGFYAMTTPNVWGWHTPPWKGSCRALAELHLTYADGTTEMISTGPHWKASTGPVTADSMYGGEDYDARLDPGDWTAAGFDDSTWDDALIAAFPEGAPTITPAEHDPVRMVETFAVSWQQLGPRSWVADLGSVIAGWCRYELLTDDPITITATHGERLRADGSVDNDNEHVTGAMQVDHLRLDHDHRRFSPRFSYKGFRYVQVDGLDDVPRHLELTGERVTASMPRWAEFGCSDPYLERFHQAMVRTLDNNLIHLPTDTPTYEKNGWTGDAQTALPAILTSYDAERLLTKWLNDLRDAQRPDGWLPVIAPTPGWGFEGWQSPEWTTVYPHLLSELVAEYGATSLIDGHLEPVLASLRWELSRRDDDGLVDSVCGDYLSPGTPGPPPEDRRFTGSLFLARALHDAARLCRRTAADHTADELAAAADGMVAAVDRVFWDESAGCYRTSTAEYRQTPNLLAVGMGFAPPDRRDRVVASVVADLESRDRHHNIGHIGSRYLMPVLADHGHAQLALDVLRRDGTPGWKQWLDQGHLTFMEMWESPRSSCHYFHGTPAIWLYEGLVGLRRSAEGWQHFTVTPQLDTDVRRARLNRGTRRGTVSVDWDLDRGTIEVQVPDGSTATLRLPGRTVDLSPGTTAVALD